LSGCALGVQQKEKERENCGQGGDRSPHGGSGKEGKKGGKSARLNFRWRAKGRRMCQVSYSQPYRKREKKAKKRRSYVAVFPGKKERSTETAALTCQ